MKYLLIIIFFLSFLGSVKSQDSTSTNQLQKAKKVNYGIIVGTHFSSFSKDNYSFGTYTIPYVSYNLTPKTSINAGFLISSNNSYFKNNSETNPYNSISGNYLYLSAKHQVNDRLIITGSMLVNTNKTYNSEINNFNKNLQNSSIGFDYKITEHLYFGTEFSFSNVNNPLNHSPFHSQSPIFTNW
ncbi:MAG: hypothetical protein A2046_01895 [Bacteroidetes bacterium GWA2_30_7]|nr:MAG: hypothetical protein A2046_01895 [Bacteroidetes bacterium GWA2_30_7]